MELLLILSAMLSAVTAAFSGVRGPEARVHQAEAAVQVAAAVVKEVAGQAVPSRPEDAPPTSDVEALPLFALAAAVPLYADRLIE